LPCNIFSNAFLASGKLSSHDFSNFLLSFLTEQASNEIIAGKDKVDIVGERDI
jgi:hypothetical protein